jgi:hypothetical protein
MTTKIYYSLISCGDGSAYAKFFYDEVCANFDQYLESEYGEGLPEDCVGEVEFEADGILKSKNVKAYGEYIKILETKLDKAKGKEKEEIQDFIDDFYKLLNNGK